MNQEIQYSLGKELVLSDDRRSFIKFEQKGKTYRAVNPQKKQIICYEVDGHLTGTQQCDNAMELANQKVIYFIELKGGHLEDAIGQLSDIIEFFNSKLQGYIVHGRVVCSKIKTPALRSSKYQRLKNELATRGGTLKQAEGEFEENI